MSGAAWPIERVRHLPLFGHVPPSVAAHVRGLGIGRINVWHLEACLAALCWLAGLRLMVSARLRQAQRQRMWVCLSLFCYVMCLMCNEAFLDYRGDISFVIGVLLLTPVLLAMSPLVRYREWRARKRHSVFFDLFGDDHS